MQTFLFSSYSSICGKIVEWSAKFVKLYFLVWMMTKGESFYPSIMRVRVLVYISWWLNGTKMFRTNSSQWQSYTESEYSSYRSCKYEICVKKLCDAKDSQTLLLADLVEVSISSFYNNATANSFFFPLRLKKNVWYVIR